MRVFSPLVELFRLPAANLACNGATTVSTGVLTRFDERGCRMRTLNGVGGDVSVQFPWERCNEHLVGVVRECDAFRIQVEIIGESVVRASVEVDKVGVDASMHSGNRLAGEMHIVSLLVTMWSELVVLPHKTPDILSFPSLDASHATGLWPHQLNALQWMERLETIATASPLMYEHNLKITDTWYVDVDDECFTTQPGWREARVRGGVVGDFAGAGKTATALCHSMRMRANGEPASTLIIVPLNLVDQWLSEIGRFCPNANTIPMIVGKHARRTMRELQSADFVVTTFAFLRQSRAYSQIMEDGVQARTGLDRKWCRNRAALATYRRIAQPDDIAIVECILWNRILVDEIHEAFADARNFRLISTIPTRLAWGISATPELWSELAQQHYWLLRREKEHHPNLLHHLLHLCVYMTRRDPRDECSSICVTALNCNSTEEETHVRNAVETQSVERIVQSCTDVMITDEQESWEETRFTAEQRVRVATLTRDLEDATEMQKVCHGETSGDADMAVDATADDLSRETERSLLERCVDVERKALQRLVDTISDVSSGHSTCCVCMDAPQAVILNCTHAFCRRCIDRHRATNACCPVCREPISLVRGIARAGTKLSHIADMCSQIREPMLVFVQWKNVRRALKAILRGRDMRVYTLEGNVSQRKKALTDFQEDSQGVIVLTLEDSYSGLHLPNARHVIFSHAIVADREHVAQMEYQAIARCTRVGQTHNVCVHSFVLAGIEEDFWHSTHTG